MRSALDVARRYVITSQVTFFVPLAVCVVWNHSRAANVDGISYYGVHVPTLPLVSVGYLGGATFLALASRTVRHELPREFSWGLSVVAMSLPVLLLTPYSAGPWWNWSHMVVGIVSALVEFALAIDLVVRRPGRTNYAAGGVQLLGGLLAAASLPSWNFPHLLPGEILFELGFAWTMIRWLHPAGVRVSALST